VADGARHQRLAARPLESPGGGEQAGDHEDQRDSRLGAEGVGRQHRGERSLAHTGPHEEAAAVDVVGLRAAEQFEDDEGDRLDEADGADGEVGPRQVVDLERDRDVGHHPAEGEDRAREEQQPEPSRRAPRGDVHAQPAKALTPREALGHDRPCSAP
jgi:hypothetical protein